MSLRDILRTKRSSVAIDDEMPPRALTTAELTARQPVNFEWADDMPEHLSLRDPRLGALIQAIDTAAIDPVDTPLSPTALPELRAGRHVVYVDTPLDLPEGADVASYAIPLSVDAFVAAPGIINWQHGRGNDAKNGRQSADVVREYARQPGQTAPPIRHATVYVRPDGVTFAQLNGDGAHRLCAAKRRGDTHIYAQDVRIVFL